MTRRTPLFLVCIAVGCSTSGADLGVETGPCIEGQCLGDLQCLSDVGYCVSP